MSVLLCVVLAGLSSPTWARTIYVDDDATGVHDSTSWDAWRYLQNALSFASAGDEIRVAQGVYRPDQGINHTAGDRHATFRVPDGVTIKGGFAGVGAPDPNLRDVARFATVLTGDLAGNDDPNDERRWLDNAKHIITAMSVDAGTVLDGLIIAHGYGEDKYDAALYNEGGSLVVRDCTFRHNGARGGDGAVYNHKGNLRLEHCCFTRNWTDATAGALHNEEGSVEVIASEFVENECSAGAPGVFNDGGRAVFSGCLFRANRSWDGLGVVWSAGETSLLYCTFIDNYSLEHEAGITCARGRTRFAHCLFSGNRGAEGTLHVRGGSVSLDQCTFYGNVGWWGDDDGFAGALYGPDFFRPDAGTVTARGCIFWGNRNLRNEVTGYDAQVKGDPNLLKLEYCCIEGWTPDRGGIGNIDADPLFVAPDQNDFHLKSQAGHWDAASLAWVLDDVTSPCIDAGDPNSPVGPEPFPDGGRVNLGVYGGTCEASKSWFGTEPGPDVDAADLNGDGRVDDEDYRLATLRWPQVDQ